MSQQALNLSIRQIRKYGDTPIPVYTLFKKRDDDILRNRNIGKFIYLNEEENQILRSNANKVGLSESSYIRCLIMGYKPKEQPTEIVYEMINQIRGIGTNLNQIARKANSLNMIDAPQYNNVYKRINKLEEELKEKLLDRD